MAVRRTFEDVVKLRQVHRISDAREGLTEAQQEEYRRDAARFLEVTRGMAECTWTRNDHAWLSRRNRSILGQTKEGQRELQRFDDAPLLMDGEIDVVNVASGGGAGGGGDGCCSINLFD